MKVAVTHLITGLGKGGAETMLYQVLKYSDNSNFKHSVISLNGNGYYGALIDQLGVEVIAVNLKHNPFKALSNIIKHLKKTDVLNCWMYHSNFLGYFLGKYCRAKKIIWNIRHSNLDEDKNKSNTLKINRFCAKMSKNIDIVTYNGEEAKRVHEEIGYCKEKSVVLDNGVDTDEYKFISSAKDEISEELNIPNNKRIVLSVAKYHPIKDIPTFIKAFSLVQGEEHDTVAVMCGNGIDESNKELILLCEENGLVVGEDIKLLSLRHDIAKLFSACDVYVLHSAGEAFPNTLVQAMATGTLCVTTDVGDAARILENDPKSIVQAGDAEALKTKIKDKLHLTDNEICLESQRNIEIVQTKFDIKKIIDEYQNLYQF